MTSSHQKAAQLLAATADLLDQAQAMNRLSVAFTAIGVGVMLVPLFPASESLLPIAGIVVLVGLIQLALAMRVGFDAALLRRLSVDAAADRLDMAGADAALAALSFMPGSKPAKPIPRRCADARFRFVLQALALLAQAGLAVFGGIGMLLGLD